MTNQYNKSESVGTSWLRARRVIFENKYQRHPCVRFTEEEVVNLGDKVTARDNAILEVNIENEEDFNSEFSLYHPETGEKLEQTATYGDLNILLYSLYINLAVERDNPPEEGEVIDEEE